MPVQGSPVLCLKLFDDFYQELSAPAAEGPRPVESWSDITLNAELWATNKTGAKLKTARKLLWDVNCLHELSACISLYRAGPELPPRSARIYVNPATKAPHAVLVDLTTQTLRRLATPRRPTSSVTTTTCSGCCWAIVAGWLSIRTSCWTTLGGSTPGILWKAILSGLANEKRFSRIKSCSRSSCLTGRLIYSKCNCSVCVESCYKL